MPRRDQLKAPHDDWLGRFTEMARPCLKRLFPPLGASLPEFLTEKLQRLEKTEADTKRGTDE